MIVQLQLCIDCLCCVCIHFVIADDHYITGRKLTLRLLDPIIVDPCSFSIADTYISNHSDDRRDFGQRFREIGDQTETAFSFSIVLDRIMTLIYSKLGNFTLYSVVIG